MTIILKSKRHPGMNIILKKKPPQPYKTLGSKWVKRKTTKKRA